MNFDGSVDSSLILGAVNEMLSAIGEPPVNTLEGEANLDVSNALRILMTVNREIQSKGWTFNIEKNLTLFPDAFSGMIPFDLDILNMRSSATSTPYVNIGGYVFDRLTRQDRFEGPISVDVIRQRTLEEMPECFRRWIVVRASKRFAGRFLADPSTIDMLNAEENEARVECNTFELDYGNYNVLQGDSYITQMLQRG